MTTEKENAVEFNDSDSLSHKAITQAIYDSFKNKGGLEFAEEAVAHMQETFQTIDRHWFPENYRTLFYLGYCFGRKEEIESLAQSHFLMRWLNSEEYDEDESGEEDY